MALFRCIKTHTAATVVKRKQRKASDGTVTVLEFEQDIVIKPGAYGHEDIKVGEVYEINGYLADKARANTAYFEEVKDVMEVAPAITAASVVAETDAEVEVLEKVTFDEVVDEEEAVNVSNESGDTQQSA